MLFMTVIIWQALLRSEQDALSNHVASTASSAREFLRAELEVNADSVSWLAKRWESREGPAGAEWTKDALLQLENDPEFIGIAWVANSREVLSSVPSGAPVPVDFSADGPAARAFAQAGTDKSPAVFSQIKLAGGRPGFMIAAPLWNEGVFRGLIAGFFDSRACVQKAMNNSRPEWKGYSFSVTSGTTGLYRSGTEPANAWAQELPIGSSMVDWKVSVWPGEDVVNDYISALPYAIFALGLVSSFFVSVLFSLVQTNRRRRKELENANRLLGAEAVQRGRTEAELRRSEEKFRAIVETMSDWIWEMDESARYTYVSPGAAAIVGYGPEELLGRRPWEFMPPGEADRFKNEFSRISRARGPFSLLENVNMRKDGSFVVLETSGAPVFGKDGEFAGYMGVHRNVTKRKKAEDDLKRSNERLENAQRIARLGSWDWDIEKDELHWSDEIYRIFGVRPEEFDATYEAFLGFVHPEDRMSVHRSVTEALTLRKPYSIEHRIVLSDGTLKVVQEQGEVEFSEAGSPVAMYGTVQDISERKQIEEQLSLYRDHLRELVEERTAELNGLNEKLKFEVEIRKKAEEAVISMNEAIEKRAVELERVNKELEAFTYSASHDLQEPLRVISGYIQLLGRRYRGRLDADADEFISFAVDGVARMQRLISDLLSYSRVGRISSLAPVDFEAALLRARANLSVAIEESGAIVRHGALPIVMADESQIDQLLMNLLNNAIKYRGEAVPLITVNAVKEDGEWIFSVSDNGIGIDPKYAEQVFDIFKRLHGSAEYPGTGIGLSICKKVVENHGGRIWVESLPGAGSTFYFTIPGKETDDE